MRIAIQYEKNSTGKSKFIQRLIPALQRLGIEIVKTRPDITLGLQYWKDKPYGKAIIRVDGIHIEKDEKYSWRRHLIKDAIKKSDGVIFQSKFAYDMLTKILNVHGKKEFIIYNGASPDDYKVKPIKSPYEKNIIISGRYATDKVRPHKRIKEMVEIAKSYVKKHDNVRFWFLGKTRGEQSENLQIKYTGDLDEKEIRRYLVMADVMLNIGYWDWCPNSVVEALVAGCPVICGNHGGVPEIVKDCGMILPIDSVPLKPKLQKNKPPEIRTNLVIEALDLIFNSPMKPVNAEHLYIDRIAQQYKKSFEKIIK